MGTVKIRKLANAFMPEATPSDWIPWEVLSVIYRFGRKHGGLWVGGTVHVSSSGMSFVPNSLNRAVHDHLEPIDIPAEEIRDVRREFGWVTGIVVVRHTGGELRFRCYGAKQFAAVIAANFNVGLEAHAGLER